MAGKPISPRHNYFQGYPVEPDPEIKAIQDLNLDPLDAYVEVLYQKTFKSRSRIAAFTIMRSAPCSPCGRPTRMALGNLSPKHGAASFHSRLESPWSRPK